MAAPNILGLALLKVNSDLYGRDYLDNFVPMLGELLRTSEDEVVSLPVIQRRFGEVFGLHLPQGVIATLLKKSKALGYVTENAKIYTRDTSVLSNLNFYEQRKRATYVHDHVVQSLIDYIKTAHTIELTVSQAETAIQSYLAMNMTPNMLGVYSSSANETEPRGSRYLVGSYVQHLYQTQSSDLEFFETLYKGHMIASSIYVPNIAAPTRRFKNTKVYFDTSFLVFALGYGGSSREAPCKELLDLLRESNAELRCFRHTVEELRGVLLACAQDLRAPSRHHNQGPRTDSIEYFIMQGVTASDIELLAVQIDRNLGRIGVSVHDTPPYRPQCVIDESGLASRLLADIPYRSERTLQKDVESIAAIMRLRAGHTSTIIEESRAIFVSTNSRLVFSSNEYLGVRNMNSVIPPCITDFTLTNLLWLKHPTKMPDLPRKRVIADCIAATQPDELMWKNYCSELERLDQADEVSEEDYITLRYSLEARVVLMETTLGDSDTITPSTVTEILQMIKDKREEETRKRIDEEIERRNLAESQIDLNKVKEQERLEKFHMVASRLASWIVQGGLLSILVIGSAATFPWSFPSIDAAPFQYGGSALQLGIAVLAIINLMWGTPASRFVESLESKVALNIQTYLLRLLG